MSRYTVQIIKPVSDYLRGWVNVEAASEDEALDKVQDMDLDDVEFEFWCCGDSVEEMSFDVIHKDETDA